MSPPPHGIQCPAARPLSGNRKTSLPDEATTNARGAYIERLRYTIKTYSRNIKELGELAGIEVNTDTVRLENDDVQLAQAGLHVRFKFDGKGPIGMNDGEASGGQQVMKSLILLIGLLKSDDGSGGFVFIDEPFAHLDDAADAQHRCL